jgi:lipoprotein NlpD
MAPVSDYSLNAPQPQRAPVSSTPAGYYRVQSGDTLYSIAWRYDKDYRALARANDIDASYRIYPGQLVSITDALEPSSVKTAAQPVDTSPVITTSIATPPSPPTPAPVATSAAPHRAAAKNGPLVWRWPARGRVIQSFGAKGKDSNGLNISGRRGEPVFSAAAGVVVYAGNGLLGYGNLVIINHDETYLSAYAHNDKLLVKEQDRVDVGDKIAEIGNSGVTQIMLHFEIRKEGKPVDPIRYLPPR